MHDHSQHNEPDNTPEKGAMSVLLADPPWTPMQTGRLGAASHYELMTNDEILGMSEAIQHIMAEDSVCFLWVTTATLPLGIRVLRQWGFEYKSFLFWGKLTLGLGMPFRNSGELLLYGKRGKGVEVAFKGQMNWMVAGRGIHSEKPPEVHALIDRLVGTDAPRLELFARRTPPSAEHWDVWGREVASTVSLAKWGYPVPSDYDEQSTDHRRVPKGPDGRSEAHIATETAE